MTLETPDAGPRIGCVGFGRNLTHYAARLNFVELPETITHAPRSATLSRWREAVSPSFTFAVRAHQLITHGAGHPAFARLPQPWQHRGRGALPFFPTALALAALDDTLGAAQRLAAPLIVFETPASFRPTATHRQRLAAFFSQAPRPGLRFVWHPLGLWQSAETQAICRELSLLLATDPLLGDDLPAAPPSYFRLRQPSYHASELFRLRDFVSANPEEQIFVFPGPASISQAVAFQRACAEESDEA